MAGKLDQILTAQGTMGTTLSAVKQRLDDDHERIFGGPGQQGALKYLADNDEKISKALAEATKQFTDALAGTTKQFTDALTVVKADVTDLKNDKKVHKAYMAGGVAAGSFFGWIIKAGLLKVGVHLP